MTLAECQQNSSFRGKPLSLCMNKTRWDQVLDFYNTTGARMVFGLSYFTDSSGEWRSENAEALLRYTAGPSNSHYYLGLGSRFRAPLPDSNETLCM